MTCNEKLVMTFVTTFFFLYLTPFTFFIFFLIHVLPVQYILDNITEKLKHNQGTVSSHFT